MKEGRKYHLCWCLVFAYFFVGGFYLLMVLVENREKAFPAMKAGEVLSSSPKTETSNNPDGTSFLPLEYNHPRFSREKLGNMSWNILHLISAFVPDNLDLKNNEELNAFLALFAKYYPCKMCGRHFTSILKQHPFSGSTKKDFMVYLCDRHNDVNRRLKKPIFPCNLVEKAWGEKGCGCTPEELLKDPSKAN